MTTNVKAVVTGNKLFIEVDLSANGEKSTSGKSILFASTHGNIKVEGTDIVLGLNCYKPVPKDSWTAEMIVADFRKKQALRAERAAVKG